MRKLTPLSTAVAAALAALVLAGGAAAKDTNVSVATAPGAHVGAASTVTIRVWFRGKPYAKPGWRPTLYLLRGSSLLPVETYRGVAAGQGTFRVRVVFPRPGAWKYVIPDPVTGEWVFLAPRVSA
jgi:hypothetical protein